MTYILLITGLLAAVTLVAFLFRSPVHRESESPPPPPGCCGAHATCKKATRPAPPPAEYFDDEELDAFCDMPPGSYTTDQIDIFRDILHTLLPGEVAGWLASLEKRSIALPDLLRQEALAKSDETDRP
ncbi:MAG: hypothetical protein LBP56_10210 [Odoribacteraceae bacterium]|jgi:hypothetical protein|nr:hypothetical protein [Odoribacteraceae bacterium]